MSGRLRYYSFGILIFVLTVLCLYVIRSVAVPFLLALILAYFLDPSVDFLERRRIPRSAAIVLVFAVFILVAGTLLAFIIPILKKEFLLIQRSLPGYAESLYRLIPKPFLQGLGIAGGQDLQGLLSRLLAGVKTLSFDVVHQVVIFLSRAFSSTFGLLLAILGYFIIPVYLFYLLRDFDRMKETAVVLVPPRFRENVLALGREVDEALGGFIRGQLSVCLVLALLYSLGLTVIGVDLAVVIGIGAGLAFIIPYLGTILGVSIAGVLAVVKFHDVLHPALVIGWFVLVQALEGTVITPRLVGNRVGLHPVVIILAVLIGGQLFGFFGLLLAVPTAASGRILLRHGLEAYRTSTFFIRSAPVGETHAEDP